MTTAAAFILQIRDETGKMIKSGSGRRGIYDG